MDNVTKDLLGRSLQMTERWLAAEGDVPDPEVKQLHDDLVSVHLTQMAENTPQPIDARGDIKGKDSYIPFDGGNTPCADQSTVTWVDVVTLPETSNWHSVALLPANHAELADVNSWRASCGYSKAWWNSATKRWWLADPHGKGSRDITDRVTHWGNLPCVPTIPSEN